MKIFTVDELLYALMVQSANDAATALAIQAACEFVLLGGANWR